MPTMKTHYGTLTTVKATTTVHSISQNNAMYEGWNFNSGNYLFTTDTK